VLAIPQHEEKFYKVMKGRSLHDEKLNRNKDYLRKKIGTIAKWLDQYLTNDFLRGKVDEVLKITDGSLAPLDYKFAEYKDIVYETYKQQLFCYAVLIEANFNEKVNKGFLVYTRSNHKLIKIQIDEADKNLILISIEEINKIIEGNFFPKATKFKQRCLNCTKKKYMHQMNLIRI